MLPKRITTALRPLWIWGVVGLLPLAIYVLTLLLREPSLRTVGRYVRYNTIVIVPLIFILLYLTYRLPSWWGSAVSLTVVMALYALTLVGLWSSGLDNYYAVSGLLPWSDARDYYIDALRLLEGGMLSDFSAWHPLFPVFLAPLLGLVSRDLQVAVSVLSLMVAFSSYLAGREVQRTHGAAAGAFVTTVLFVYYRQFSGTLVSENLGLMLGSLGFAVLWRGAAQQQRRVALWGAFLLALGMVSRLGTFFMLPALVIWFGWTFKPAGRCGVGVRGWIGQFSWRSAGASMGVFAAAWAIYFISIGVFAPRQELLFPNYASPFYDFTTGYRFWGSLREDHPEIFQLQDPQLSRLTYQAAQDEILSHPSAMLSGAYQQYETFFARDWYSAYSFFETRNDIAKAIINGGLYSLCLVGLVECIRQRRNPLYALMVAVFLGFFISIPFVPPGMFNRMRTYAASIVVLAVLPALGLAVIWRLFNRWKWLREDYLRVLSAPVSSAYGAVLVLFLLVGTLGVWLLGRSTSYTEIICKPAQQVVYVRLYPHSQVNVLPDVGEEIDMNWLPDFRNGRFKRYLHDYSPHYLAMEEFEKLKPPATVLVGLDLKSNQDLCLLSSMNQVPEQPGMMAICGRWSDNPKVQSDRFFYGEQISFQPTR